MIKEQKKALRQLHQKLIELIREIESGDSPCSLPVKLQTEDFEFRLEYSKKLKRFFIVVEED